MFFKSFVSFLKSKRFCLVTPKPEYFIERKTPITKVLISLDLAFCMLMALLLLFDYTTFFPENFAPEA
jgi:hypothetical protein